MNCHTCAHNRYESCVGNVCRHPDMQAAIDGVDSDGADQIDGWMMGQEWDDNGLCPEITTPCPGWQAKEPE